MNTAMKAMGCAVLASGVLLGSVGAAQAATLAPESQQIAAGTSGETIVQEPIHRVWGWRCTFPNTYLKTYSPTGDTCWTGSGTVYVNLYDVRKFKPGYNSGYYLTNYGVRREFRGINIPRLVFPSEHITKIVIY